MSSLSRVFKVIAIAGCLLILVIVVICCSCVSIPSTTEFPVYNNVDCDAPKDQALAKTPIIVSEPTIKQTNSFDRWTVIVSGLSLFLALAILFVAMPIVLTSTHFQQTSSIIGKENDPMALLPNSQESEQYSPTSHKALVVYGMGFATIVALILIVAVRGGFELKSSLTLDKDSHNCSDDMHASKDCHMNIDQLVRIGAFDGSEADDPHTSPDISNESTEAREAFDRLHAALCEWHSQNHDDHHCVDSTTNPRYNRQVHSIPVTVHALKQKWRRGSVHCSPSYTYKSIMFAAAQKLKVANVPNLLLVEGRVQDVPTFCLLKLTEFGKSAQACHYQSLLESVACLNDVVVKECNLAHCQIQK